ncbi:MAG: biotin/lipoyl-containing protein [Phycisphaeraceae bacterium]
MKLRITVEGVAYEVDVEVLEESAGSPAPASYRSSPAAAPTAPAAPAPARPAASTVSPGDKVCKAPIAGTITKINAKVGDTVEVNQVLLVMEAMKMETNISSPVAGRVRNIKATAGAAVKTGDVLVEFE